MIFVTGGTGMVGAHLLYDLVQKGEKVRALKRTGSDTEKTKKIFSFYSSDYQLLFQRIEWVEGDILDKERLYELLKGIDQVYHAAAMVSFDPKDHLEMAQNNCEGTANLVDVALSMQIPRFCYVSSIAAIGTAPEGTEANELHPWCNNINRSAYSESKFLAEMEVWRAIIQGLGAVIVNPSVILGPGDWKSGSPSLFSAVVKGMPFYTKGGTGFVDVKDVTIAMQRLMRDDAWDKVKGQRFILNAENMPFRDLISQIAIALGLKPPKYFAGATLLKLASLLSRLHGLLTGTRPSITRDMVRSANKKDFYDGTKIGRVIGFSYRPVEESIRDISALCVTLKKRTDHNNLAEIGKTDSLPTLLQK